MNIISDSNNAERTKACKQPMVWRKGPHVANSINANRDHIEDAISDAASKATTVGPRDHTMDPTDNAYTERVFLPPTGVVP